jgi:hypothetical protein
MIPERYKHDRLCATILKSQGCTTRFSAGSAEDEGCDDIVIELWALLEKSRCPTPHYGFYTQGDSETYESLPLVAYIR